MSERVKAMHVRRGFEIKVTKAGPDAFLLHVTDEGASRWMDLTLEEAIELRNALNRAMTSGR